MAAHAPAHAPSHPPSPSHSSQQPHPAAHTPTTGASDRETAAAHAVAPSHQAVAPDQALLTPSLEAIMAAFARDGHGDSELLKLIVHAKAKEDERLAALDVLRAEQVRLAQTYAAVHLYQQHAQVLALQSASHALKGPPPYSPLSPPPSDGAAHGLKRARTPSDASSASAPSEPASSTSKRAKTAAPAPPAVPATKPTRADVMAALRLKCEANQRANHQQAHQQQQVSHARTSPSLSPPLAASSTASSSSSTRRVTPPKPASARHTPFLRPAAPPTTSVSPPPPAPASDPACPSTRNKLALLLHASESSAALAPDWHPMPAVATSDVRGEAQHPRQP